MYLLFLEIAVFCREILKRHEEAAKNNKESEERYSIFFIDL